jgi:hypothetical protein
MKKKRTFAYLGAYEIVKTTVAFEAIKYGLSNVRGSVCKHKNQERIDYGTNICKDCRRLICTLKQTGH